MLYKPDSLEVTVEQMRALGEQLIPYNAPRASKENENDIGVLKSRRILVDGYEVNVYYTKSDFGEYKTEVVQIWGEFAPFLPFNLICKMAKAFLGGAHLSLVELFKGNRKVYCWTVTVDEDGKPRPSPYEAETEECTFEGFTYSYLQPNQVNFY